MAHYCTDFSNKFEIINPEIYHDENGDRVLELDFELVSDIENAKQAVYNRLITYYGEFKLFQYYKFYNLAYDYFMTTNIPTAKIGMKIATMDCLDSEPFVETVNEVFVESINDNRAFLITSNITLIGGETFDMAYILRNDMTVDWISETEDQIYEA